MDDLDAIRAKKLRELTERASRSQGSTTSGEPFPLTDDSFPKALRRHPLLLVDFWAPWCGPCRMVAPVVREVAKDYRGRVAVGKLNTDENPRTAARFRILSIPTLMLFKDGAPVDTLVGAAPRGRLEAMIQKHLA